MTHCDYLIVGAGITGITAANILATEHNKKVVVVEKRNHMGGNCYDCHNDEGILIHLYGPHIFHTQHKDVWDYLSQFTDWLPYVHKVKAWIDGKYISFPINIITFEDLFDRPFTEKQVEEWLHNEKVHIPEIKNAEDMVISRMGQTIYETFFKTYTQKQWGVDAKELAPEITARIPIRMNRDENFFTDPYQGMPKDGYTAMFKKMLNNENITLIMDTEYKEIIGDVKYDRMIFTGPVDEYFDYKFGYLPYRGIDFVFKTYDQEQKFPVAVINYPNDYDYTRATEFKHMTFQNQPKTTVCFEYPGEVKSGQNEMVPSYPILNPGSQLLFSKYKRDIEKLPNVFFGGRLGGFQYLNMDICVKNVMEQIHFSVIEGLPFNV